MVQKDLLTRTLIVNDRKGGMSYGELSKKYKISKMGARKICEKEKITGSVQNQPGKGRKRATTSRDDSKIVREAIKNPTVAAKDIKENLSLDISLSTIKRRLRETSLQNKIAKKKPFISKINKAKRLKFAQKYCHMPISFWKKIIWTDESKFMLFGSKKRKRVWRKPHQALQDRFLQQTVKHGGGSIMIWGCFSWYGVGKLEKVIGKMTGAGYVDILTNNLQSSAEKMGLSEFIFQQDNDPKHTSKIASQFFEQNNIEKLEWPSQSPDLNPIEHLWTILDSNIERKKRTNATDFYNEMLKSWEELDGQMMRNLVESMPKRLRAVIQNKGGATSY